MKDIYRNPTLYYILVPVIVALWPLLIWAVYLPNAEDRLTAEKGQYVEAQSIIAEILTLDPDRPGFADTGGAETEFDYARAVERIATLCNIPPTNYRLSSGMTITSGEKKSQSAKVDLKDVDIVSFAKFLSTIQLRWASLQCTKVKLNKKQGLPDKWDADLDFKYYY
jgi:hypothetical protein